MISVSAPRSLTDGLAFDPGSGWCFLDRSPEAVLFNPATGINHRLEGSMARRVRQILVNGHSPSNHTFPFFDKELREALQSERFIRNATPREILGLDDPTQLWIEVQGSCNEQCVHCYANSAPKDLPSLDRDTVRSVLRDGADLGFSLVQFTGGDPLLWDDLPAMVSLADDLGLQSEIYTNGLLLDEKLYEKVVDHDTRFAFSFYSHEPEVHDSITQHPGSWNRTVEAIKRALQGPTPVRIGVVMMDRNRGQEDEIVEFLRDLGIGPDRINVAYTQTVGRGQSLAENGAPAPSESGGPDRSSGTSSSSSQSNGHFSGERSNFNPGKLCVSYRGEVIPCIFQRDLSLGSIHRRSLSEIVSNPDLGRTAAGLSQDLEIPHDPDRLTCSECRFHAFVLHNLVRESDEIPRVGDSVA